MYAIRSYYVGGTADNNKFNILWQMGEGMEHFMVPFSMTEMGYGNHYVITSYSIHYTKLYEKAMAALAHEPR